MRQVKWEEYINYVDNLEYVRFKTLRQGLIMCFVDDLLVAFREDEANFFILK